MTDKQKKKSKKRVSFSPSLIRGPSGPNYEHGETSDLGNTSVSQHGSEDQGSLSESESEDETEGLTFVEDTGTTSSIDGYMLARDRARRKTVRPPSRYEDANLVADALAVAEEIEKQEPKYFKEAMSSKDWKHWKNDANDEMDSLERNHTWDLIERPKDQKTAGCKWIFKYKLGIPGVEDRRHKGRLVANGFSQKEGIDYNEIFSPVVKHISIKLMLSIVEQLDVKTAFLHGNLDKRILMDQTEGYVKPGDENKVCLLRKFLYGLKQSPKQWNIRFDSFMKKEKFLQSDYDSCVYMRSVNTPKAIYLLLYVYVNDMLIASGDKTKIQKMKDSLSREFEMKDLGRASRILRMDIIRDRKKGTLVLSQEAYIEKVIKSFGMEDSKPVTTPLAPQFKLKSLTKAYALEQSAKVEGIPYATAVVSLMYAMIGSQPNLAHAVGVVSRFMSKPEMDHW